MARGRPPMPRADGSNLQKSTFLEIYDEAIDAKAVLDSARGKYQAIFKRAETLGINRSALSWALKQSSRDRDKREIDDRDYRRYMAWLDMPLGTQAGFDFAAPVAPAPESEADKAATEAHRQSTAYHQGVDAGRAGANISSCPYDVGSEEAQQFHSGWHAGQGEKVSIELAPRRRGRARGGVAASVSEAPSGPDPAVPNGHDDSPSVPTPNVAHLQGEKARQRGEDVTENPYGTDTPEHETWKAGWLAATGPEAALDDSPTA